MYETLLNLNIFKIEVYSSFSLLIIWKFKKQINKIIISTD